jgi:hypothetical protein
MGLIFDLVLIFVLCVLSGKSLSAVLSYAVFPRSNIPFRLISNAAQGMVI